MAAALAILKVASLVAAFGLVGLMGVNLDQAQAAPSLAATATLSVDRHLVNICEEVTFTTTYTATVVGRKYRVTLQNVHNDGTSGSSYSFMHTTSSNDLGTTRTHGVSLCSPGRYTYRVKVERQFTSGLTTTYYFVAYSNSVIVQSLHPAEGGTERLRTVSDGGVYTSVAPVITGLSYDAPEAAVNAGVVSYDASVLVKWLAVPRATGYELVSNSPTEEVTRETTDTEAASTQASIAFTDIYPNDEQDVQTTFQVRAFLENGESSPVILDTGTGSVAVDVGAKVYSPLSEMASIVVRRQGINTPIDTKSAGEPSTVAPGAAPEGITEVARLIAQHTGMGAGAATTLLPLLCLLLAGGAAAVVVLPLGFSPLSLAAGFLVFTLVWSVGGVAWFGLPIAVAALPPVLLAASGVMIVRRRGMFG